MNSPAATNVLDPITLAVVQNGLQQVCNEMDLAFCRAAFSPVISEGMDRSDGIYSREDGALIAQGDLGLPVFVGTMQFSTRNVIERVMILAAGGPETIITADMLPQDVGSMVPAMPTSNNGEHIMGLPLCEAREVFERDYLIAQISRFSGNISRTAEFVGMERSALHRKLKALGVG